MITILGWLASGYTCSAWCRRLPSLGAMLAVGMAMYILVGILGALLGMPFITRWLFPGLACAAAVAVMVSQHGKHVSPKRTFSYPVWKLILTTLILAGVVLLGIQTGMPVGNYDILSYHIPLARSFGGGDAGQSILLHPDTFYARLPLGAPILQAPFLSLAWGGEVGYGLQAFSLLAVLAAADSARRITRHLGGRPAAGLLAALLVVMLPMNASAVLAGLFDPLLGLFALAAAEFLLRGAGRRGRGSDWLSAGLLMGGAVALKLNAVGVVLIPMMMVAAAILCSRRLWRSGALLVCGIFLSAAPWVIRGLPVGPFADLGDQWTSEQAAFVVDVHQPILPLGLLWWRDFVAKIQSLGYPIPMLGLPCLLLAALARVAERRGRGFEKWLVLAALAGFSAWLCVRLNPGRFLIPSVLLLVPPAAAFLARPSIVCRWRRWAPLSAFVLIAFIPATAPTARVAFGIEPTWNPFQRDLELGQWLGEPVMLMTRVAREEASAGGRVLLLFESRMGLFPEGTSGRTVWDQPSWAPLLRESPTPNHFLQKLRAEGFTAVYVNEFEWGRLIDFYARKELPGDQPLRGLLGVTSHIVPREFIHMGLRAFPPHRFAGLEEPDLTVLQHFLISLRTATPVVASAGTGAEIWMARLPATFPD